MLSKNKYTATDSGLLGKVAQLAYTSNGMATLEDLKNIAWKHGLTFTVVEGR